MMMEIEELGSRGLRNFGFTTGLIVVVIFGLLLPWLFSASFPVWPWLIAGSLWLFALVFPMALNPVYKGWMKFGNIAGWINSRIILSVLFYFIVFPMGLIMKILGKDPMMRKFDKSVSSYRVLSSTRPESSLEKPF